MTSEQREQPSRSEGSRAGVSPVLDREAGQPAGQVSVEVRRMEESAGRHVYATLSVPSNLPTREAAERLYAAAADLIRTERIQPVIEKVYGVREARDVVLELRRRLFSAAGIDPALPVSYLQGSPASGGEIAGLQLWGVAPAPGIPNVENLDFAHGLTARSWSRPGGRLLYLPGVRGLKQDGELARCITGQGERMFLNAASCVEEGGLTYRKVIRTWIYVARLLDWYGELNRVRNGIYRELLGGSGPGAVLPASTGIQGRSAEEECSMDLLAVDADPSDVVAITETPRQGPAAAYGSAFARGMALRSEGSETVYISGTASIDTTGASVHIGEPEQQCVETLMNLASLLEARGGGLANICQATVFCKDSRAYEAYRDVTRLLGVPSFPTIPLLADVCRSDLLVEIEAVALI